MAAVYQLGTLVFPTSEQPTDGANEFAQPQEWSKFKPLGASAPGTLLTYLSSPSIEQTMTCWVTDATRDSLIAIWTARATVTWTTPDDGAGYLVQMTKLNIIKDKATRGTHRWKATFELTKAV